MIVSSQHVARYADCQGARGRAQRLGSRMLQEVRDL